MTSYDVCLLYVNIFMPSRCSIRVFQDTSSGLLDLQRPTLQAPGVAQPYVVNPRSFRDEISEDWATPSLKALDGITTLASGGRPPPTTMRIAERVRIDDIFSWQESRAITRSLTLQNDKVVYLIKPGLENDKIAGQHVTVFDYPGGRFKIRYEGRELPYPVFDRLSQIRQADIVNNKRLGATLSMALEFQLASNERRSKSCPSRPFPSASSQSKCRVLPI
jgi:hypothetical protein